MFFLTYVTGLNELLWKNTTQKIAGYPFYSEKFSTKIKFHLNGGIFLQRFDLLFNLLTDDVASEIYILFVQICWNYLKWNLLFMVMFLLTRVAHLFKVVCLYRVLDLFIQPSAMTISYTIDYEHRFIPSHNLKQFLHVFVSTTFKRSNRREII